VAERLFGIETEYGFSAFGKDGRPFSRPDALACVFDAVTADVASLPGLQGSGLYLQNGARLYVDCGMHPEVATAECSHPTELVRHVLAGDRILDAAARRTVSSSGDIGSLLFFKNNVDYAANTTWGCHESYLHRCSPDLLPKQILPHLVSRVIYTGAGGFNPLSPGIQFTLSPRASYLVSAVSADSTTSRGIFHTKDESLCRNYYRLHLICGESLCSETATWLKVGTTALVLALVEAGRTPGREVEIRDPVSALRTFAADPHAKSAVLLPSGAWVSALQIQRHYLRMAEESVGKSFMPPWAHEVCAKWREVLDRLEDAPRSVEKTLDWAIKRALFENRARRRGIPWDSLPLWNFVVSRLRQALGKANFGGSDVCVEDVLHPASPVREDVQQLSNYLRKRNLSWEGLRPFLELRQELFEIETRFGQLGERGVFTAMDREDVLDHRMPGVRPVENAVVSPPAIGRARLRGDSVRRFGSPRTNASGAALSPSGNGGGAPLPRERSPRRNTEGPSRYVCDWQGVWDAVGGRFLDLSNPFETEERWQETGPLSANARTYTRGGFRDLLSELGIAWPR